MGRKTTLWTQNYTRIIVATAMGAMGGITASFALSFLVFDETGSTFAAGLLFALNMLPGFLVPLIVAPRLDRMPRKPFLVGGDAVCGILYAAAGLYLLKHSFSFELYLLFSLLLSCLGAFDSLVYESLYPRLIPAGFEQKGYSVSSMLYPTLTVLMTPLAAVLYERVGVGWILLGQGLLSELAALVESRIRIEENDRREGGRFSFRQWREDMHGALEYLRGEKGLRSLYAYMAATNGAASGYSPILVAFFRTTPGFTVAMYSAFSVAEFLGRTLGGLLAYRVPVSKEKRFPFAFFVYRLYEAMDAVLLWLPYPFMLLNRAVCGFLGINSATLRQAAVQSYIPDEHRAKLNAFSSALFSAARGLGGLLIGALGEAIDYRLCLTLCGLGLYAFVWATVGAQRKAVAKVYGSEI